MTKYKQVMQIALQCRNCDASKFLWSCYGDGCLIFNCYNNITTNVGFVCDPVKNRLFELEYAGRVWVDSDYQEAYEKEASEHNHITDIEYVTFEKLMQLVKDNIDVKQ